MPPNDDAGVDDVRYAGDVEEDRAIPDRDLPPVHTGPVPPDEGDAGVTKVSGQ